MPTDALWILQVNVGYLATRRIALQRWLVWAQVRVWTGLIA